MKDTESGIKFYRWVLRKIYYFRRKLSIMKDTERDIKILCQNIVNNPNDFSSDKLESLFKEKIDEALESDEIWHLGLKAGIERTLKGVEQALPSDNEIKIESAEKGIFYTMGCFDTRRRVQELINKETI